jgi:lysophospholipase L1-like esterase
VITLAATNTIQGSAGTATAVTYTITGMTLSSAQAETYAVLSQGQLATSAAAIYTVPASTSALVKEILLANVTAAAVSVKLYINGTTAANQITSLNIPANGEAKFDHTGWAVYDGNGSLQTSPLYAVPAAGSFPEASVANLGMDLTVLTAAIADNGVDSGCAVTWVSGLNVAIAAGIVRIGGGRYNIAAVASQALNTADPNYARWDMITANTSSAVVYTAGTAAAYPVVPAIPVNSVVLAIIPVYAGNNPALSGAAIVDKRIILPTTNLNLPPVFDPSGGLKTWRAAVANKENKPADILFIGDSIHEGYYSSDDAHRYASLVRRRLQNYYNPTHIPGGEGFIPGTHVQGSGAGNGYIALAQRWTVVGPTLPPTDLGYGLGRRSVPLTAATHTATIGGLLADRFWIYYTATTTSGWIGIAIDGKLTTVATQGVLSGTGTGTFTTTLATGWPGGTFTLTVDDEDMTVTANGATITITARGANATTAVAHAVGATAQWAPAGVKRANTLGAAIKGGRMWDSGALTRGIHSVTVVPINRAGGGSTFNVNLDGVMVFDGDGGPGPGTFTDGVLVGTTTTGVQTLPISTINVTSTTNFPASGQVNIVTSSGAQTVTYAGVTANTLTGCSNGVGNTSAGGAVTSQTFQSASAAFTAADVGQYIYAVGIPVHTTITAVISATQITLYNPGTITSSGVTFEINGRSAGVRMWDGAHSAMTSAGMAGPAGAINGWWADALDTVDPDLVVIEFGIVDLVLSVTGATYYANLTSMVSLIKAKCPGNPSICFFVAWQPGDYTAAQWGVFVNAMYLVAQQQGCAVFDFSLRVSTAAASGAGAVMFTDTIHPNDAGAQDIALEFTKYLVGHELVQPIKSPWFGDGSDGAVVFDGTTTILGMAPSSSVYTLTRDLFVTNMTVNNGVTIKTTGFRIYGTGTLMTPIQSVASTGIIDCSGGNAAGQTAGAATANQSLSGSVGGGAGGAIGGAGVAGGTLTAAGTGPLMGGVGGIGGASTGAAGAAGANTNAVAQNLLNARTVHTATTGCAMGSFGAFQKVLYVQPGQGGGGGGGGSAVGGGGGGGGGIVLIAAATINFLGSITANGGNGGNSTNGAGGGGGGGGVVYLTCANLGLLGTVTAAGGFPGTGTAGAPASGGAGSVIITRV